MAKRSGGITFGKIVAITIIVIFSSCFLAAVGIAVATGIGCLVNHVGYVDQFKTWFPFLFKEETAEPVVEAAKALVLNVRMLLHV